jgi:hypothetical protein
MSKFVCKKCKKEFTKKEGVDYHTNNKVCTKRKEKNLKSFKCEYCGQNFSSATGMYRHIREYCKEKKKIDEKTKDMEKIKEELRTEFRKDFDNKVKEVEEKTKDLQKKYEDLKKNNEKITKKLSNQKLSNNITNINNNNIVNGNINNINLVAYGCENIDAISKEEMLEVLRAGFNSTIKLAEKIHFNVNRFILT